MGSCSVGIQKSEISEQLRLRATQIFNKMDVEQKGTIDRKTTIQFWKSNFAKVNTDALFQQVDFNQKGFITIQEWLTFWDIVKKKGYTEKEITDELDELDQGKAWVHFANVDTFIKKDRQRRQSEIQQMVQVERKITLKKSKTTEIK